MRQCKLGPSLQAAYRELFRAHIDPEMLKAIRQAAQTNRVFGSDLFQKQIEAALALPIQKRKPGLRRKESSYSLSRMTLHPKSGKQRDINYARPSIIPNFNPFKNVGQLPKIIAQKSVITPCKNSEPI